MLRETGETGLDRGPNEGRYLVDGGVVRTFSAIPGVARANGMSYDDFQRILRQNA